MVINIQFLTERQVADITGLSVRTLRNNRWQGKGIPFYKFGRSVRYRLSDVLEFAENSKVNTTF
jgi:excisionase family DNA binding protein